MKNENEECIFCGKELDDSDEEICDSCHRFLRIKYPKNKLKEVIKCHKKHAKKLKQ